MKKISLAFCLALLSSLFCPAQVSPLQFNKNGEFKIVQFTDIHFKYGNPASDIALKRIGEVLDAECPDLVVFTGDVVYAAPADTAMRKVLSYATDRKIPFVVTFGNHDNEQGKTRAELYDVIRSMPFNIQPDRGGVESPDYVLTLKSSDGKKDAALLYCMDSHSYSKLPDVKGYDWLTFDQVNWYRRQSARFRLCGDLLRRKILVRDERLCKTDQRGNNPIETDSCRHDVCPVCRQKRHAVHHDLHAALTCALLLCGLQLLHDKGLATVGHKCQHRDDPQHRSERARVRGREQVKTEAFEALAEKLNLLHIVRGEHRQVVLQCVEILNDLKLYILVRARNARNLRNEFRSLRNSVLCNMQGVRERINNGVINAEHDRERKQRRQTAAAGIHTLFFVELLQLFVILHLVLGVLLLQLLLLACQSGLRRHALLRFNREREHQRLYDDREQDDRDTVVFENGVQEPQQITEYAAEEIKNRHHSS